jgi:HJR/Mrr/RecB family endonuclease
VILKAASLLNSQSNILLLLWLSVGFALMFRVIRRLIKKEKFERAGLGDIDLMDCRVFQLSLQNFFRSRGFEVERKYVQDCSADLVIIKGKSKKFVQAKCYRGKTGIEALKEAWFARKYYGCEAIIVITNTYFTGEARRAASRQGIELWDRAALAKYLIPGGNEKRPLIGKESNN